MSGLFYTLPQTSRKFGPMETGEKKTPQHIIFQSHPSSAAFKLFGEFFILPAAIDPGQGRVIYSGRPSMYGIFSYLHLVDFHGKCIGKHTIHGSYGIVSFGNSSPYNQGTLCSWPRSIEGLIVLTSLLSFYDPPALSTTFVDLLLTEGGGWQGMAIGVMKV